MYKFLHMINYFFSDYMIMYRGLCRSATDFLYIDDSAEVQRYRPIYLGSYKESPVFFNDFS